MSEQNSADGDVQTGNALDGQNPFLVIAVLVFIAGVGFFVGMDALRDYRLQMDAHERFVPVEAKILRTEISVRRNNDTNRNSYHPAIRYTYEVEGKSYQSRLYSYFQGDRSSRSNAEAIVAAYPVDASVTAYIDPDDADRAVLDNARPDDAWKVIAFFVVFSAILLFIFGVVAKTLFQMLRSKA